jgi:HPt (histidine-containing phosphotransfer) domain-containing protein
MRTLDPSHLVRNLDGDPGLLTRIVALFFESTAPVVEAIRGNVAERDADALVRNAHQLRGALANVGAQAGAHVATELELLAREGAMDGAPRALSSLESEMEKLRPALEELVAGVRR